MDVLLLSMTVLVLCCRMIQLHYVLLLLEDGPLGKLTQLCNEIYNTGYWPKELKESIFIPIPKKSKATRCQEYRTISIMSQVTKLLLKIVMDRMKGKIEAELYDAQSGFRQGKGTREGALNIRLICERHLEVHKYVYICFLDYEKAFDRVRHEPLMQCLHEIGVDGKDIKIIRNFYWDQTASVRIVNELSEEIRIQRGVRQGCVASPTLFNLYIEQMFRHIINMKGVNVGGTNYNNLRYAGDTALLAGNEKELSDLTSKINEVGKQFGLKINIKKTKTMVVSKKPNSPKINIAIDGQHIEQVTSYVYLGSLITATPDDGNSQRKRRRRGSLITEDGRCEKEIKRRIMIARSTFTNMRTLLSCRGINLKTRLRAIKCYIWPTLFYGAETWTITKSLLSKLDAFEMWVYRRVLKISWTEKITNEEVLRRMGTGRAIVRQFKTRKLQYLGHLIRHNTSQIQLIEGKIECRRSRGRPRNTWTTDITNTKGMNYYQLKRAVEDRRRWHGLVVNLAQETTLRSWS